MAVPTKLGGNVPKWAWAGAIAVGLVVGFVFLRKSDTLAAPASAAPAGGESGRDNASGGMTADAFARLLEAMGLRPVSVGGYTDGGSTTTGTGNVDADPNRNGQLYINGVLNPAHPNYVMEQQRIANNAAEAAARASAYTVTSTPPPAISVTSPYQQSVAMLQGGASLQQLGQAGLLIQAGPPTNPPPTITQPIIAPLTQKGNGEVRILNAQGRPTGKPILTG